MAKSRAARVASQDESQSSSNDAVSPEKTGDQHLLVIVSEKQARVFGLPSQLSYVDMKAC